MKRFRWLVMVAAFAVMGCAKVHLDCSSGLPQTFSVTGSTVGNQIVALGVAAEGAAGFAGKAPGEAPTPVPQGSTLDYSWLAIFGPDNGGLGCGVVAPATTTINNNQGGTINMPPAPK
jgi:tagatose-1,6-bisphosphate aldolase non-catalytic subunit AgaZ/GatZ